MKIISRSAQETFNLGRQIAKALKPGDILCLFGELGSGKTVLAKGIACGLGVKDSQVVSPTFVLVNQYSGGKLPFYHFDLYRLKSLKEIADLGYEEYFYGKGITVLEWADRLKSLMPAEYLTIKLALVAENKRSIIFSAQGARFKELLKGLQKDL